MNSKFPRSLSNLPKARQEMLLDAQPEVGWKLQSDVFQFVLTGVRVGKTTCDERGFGVIAKYKTPEGKTYKGFWIWCDRRWKPVYVGRAPEPKGPKSTGPRPNRPDPSFRFYI